MFDVMLPRGCYFREQKHRLGGAAFMDKETTPATRNVLCIAGFDVT